MKTMDIILVIVGAALLTFTMTMYHEDQDGRAQCNKEGVEYTLFYVV